MKSNLWHSSSDSFGPRLKTGMGFQVAGRKKENLWLQNITTTNYCNVPGTKKLYLN